MLDGSLHEVQEQTKLVYGGEVRTVIISEGEGWTCLGKGMKETLGNVVKLDLDCSNPIVLYRSTKSSSLKLVHLMCLTICMFDLNLKIKRTKELALICLLSLVPALFYLASFIVLLSHLFLFNLK